MTTTSDAIDRWIITHSPRYFHDRAHRIEHAKLACTLCELLGWELTEVAYSRFVSEREREEHRR